MSRLGIGRVVFVLGLASLAAACADSGGPGAPVAAPAASAASRTVYVVVQRGQSLDQIARTFHVAKQDIIAANNLSAPYAVKPGAVLAVPGAAPEAKEAKPAPRPSPAHTASAPAPQRAAAPRPEPQHAQAQQKKTKEAPEVIPLD